MPLVPIPEPSIIRIGCLYRSQTASGPSSIEVYTLRSMGDAMANTATVLRRRCPIRRQITAAVGLIAVMTMGADLGAFQGQQPAPNIEAVDRNWVGMYLVSQSRAVPDVRSPSGRRWATSAPPTPVTETDRIPARLGVRFGVGFTIRGTPAGQEVEGRRVWRFPPMTNPATGITLSRSTNAINCRLGEPCFSGQFLANEFELVPGTWSVEIWVGDTKLLEQSFTLYRPNN
jgi:hypothetical protein